MKILPYTFVAIDLEATGLDTKNDTIIEVAAVKFNIARDDNIFYIINSEERSMLINPCIPLKEEISMITGITSKMLEGKKTWQEVKEKVREFIGDAIIVGHNVLFDISMLGSHGIDLTRHTALDTFELSEIFSMEAESLNLGFLGKHYGIKMESEHRALDDTKLSMELFLHYLSNLLKITENERSLWKTCAQKDTSGTIQKLLDLTEVDSMKEYELPYSDKKIAKKVNKDFQMNKLVPYSTKNLTGRKDEEIDIIKDIKKKNEALIIISDGRKQSEWLENKLMKLGFSTVIYNDSRLYCSLKTLGEFLKKTTWRRKESILMIKVLTWLESTKTGLLDELKFYGEEREMINLLRSEQKEWGYFHEQGDRKVKTSDIILADFWTEDILSFPLLKEDHTLVVRDIFKMEDTFRRRYTKRISFENLFGIYKDSTLSEKSERVIEALSYIESVVNSIVSRPTGPNPLPPGDFGETYFFTQKEFWNRGGKWLVLYGIILEKELIGIHENIKNLDYIESRIMCEWEKIILDLIKVIQNLDSNISIILHIDNSGSTISLIPRNIIHYIQECLRLQGGNINVLSGFGIFGDKIRKFLHSECGIIVSNGHNSPKENIPRWKISKHLYITNKKTVILSMSNKHIRAIHQELKNTQGIQEIFAQGISGGKGKMLTLFKKTENKAVLIGTIDNWTNENLLWDEADEVIIMKIPFEPPTDPFFLAKTVGMRNNFEEYSTPIAINTINTLIGRIRSSNPETLISFLDDRLEKMLWGKEIQKEIIE